MAGSANDHYCKLLEQRFDALMGSIRGFLSAEGAERKEAVERLAVELEKYSDCIAEDHKPSWLKQLAQSTRVATRNQHKISELPGIIAKHFHRIVLEIPDDAKPLDFDSAFKILRQNFQIGEFFDRIIAELKKILENEEVDSAAVQKALRTLIDVLKANRDGSFAAVKGSFSFMKYCRLMWKEYAKKVPGLKEHFAVLDKMAADGEKDLESLEKEFHRQAVEKLLANTDALLRMTGTSGIELLGWAVVPEEPQRPPALSHHVPDTTNSNPEKCSDPPVD